MTLTEAINAFKQAKIEHQQNIDAMNELRLTRLPELRLRLSGSNMSMQSAQQQMRNAVSDADFETAKQSFAQAETAYNDCAQLITNCEDKIKVWANFGLPQSETKVRDAKRQMWELKRAEVLATFPAQLPDDIRLGIQKLVSIHRLNGGSGVNSYGNHVNQIYSDIDKAELATTEAALLTEMGI